MASGIYIIRNKQNGHLYIGSSSNLHKRKNRHFQYLRNGGHENKHLQNAFIKYGESNFVFEIIQYVDTDKLLVEEQRLLDVYYGKKCCYNICKTAGSPAVAGRVKTMEHRKKISESVIKFYESHPEHKVLLGKLRTGTIASDETKQKMRQSKKRGSKHHNAKLTEEQVEQIRASYVPRKYSFGMLAKQYGVDRKTIIRIVKNKTWSHV